MSSLPTPASRPESEPPWMTTAAPASTGATWRRRPIWLARSPMAQSFSLANIVPQAAEHNRGAWAKIETDTRRYVSRASGPVYVITAPVYANPRIETIGPGQVWVPTHLFKLVYDPAAGRAWAHWSENADTARIGPPISYDELVRRTGVTWLPGFQ